MDAKYRFKTYKMRAVIILILLASIYNISCFGTEIRKTDFCSLKSLTDPTATHTTDFIPSIDPLKTTGLFHFNKVTLLFAGLGLIRQSKSITVIIIHILVFKELTHPTPVPSK